jgi:hypothetical protein
LPRKSITERSSKINRAAKKLQTSIVTRHAPGKRSAKTPKRHSTSSKAGGKRASSFHGGIYVTPNGNVSLGIPTFWTLRQTNDDLEVESPSRKTSVIVTAFRREKGVAKLDAREYLKHFLQSASIKGRVQAGKRTPSRAQSRFRDSEGDHWQIDVLTNGDTLLLATLNSNLPLRSQEARVGADILRALTLK